MRILISPGRPLATVFRSLCAIALLFGAMAGTCGEPGDGGGSSPDPTGGDAPVVTIIAPLFDRNIAAGAIITITYSVTNSPDNVIAFIDPDSDPENGNEVIFAEQLFGGENRTANFATEGIVSGVYNFGIQASNSAGADTEYARNSAGQLVTITVNGFPQPALNAPSSDVEILFNTTTSVPLSFSCNDFENDVSWEVFYDTNQVIDGTEVTIASGTGNADPGSTNVTVNWLTLSVPEGVYSIGLRCTDSAQSVASAYAAGRVTITTELSVPIVTLTQPAEDLTVFSDTDINIAFAAGNTNVQGATITLFLDTDNNGFDGSEPRIATELPLTATSVTVNSNIIPEGVYFIGGIVELGGRRSDANYAPGQLTVIGTGDITVVQPADPLTVTPGTDVVIRWNTNLPSGEGLIDLALFQSDILGNPGAPISPDPLADAKDLEISPPTAVLDTTTLTTGFYVVEVTLTPVDANDIPTGDPIATALSVPIRVTTQPTVLWVGRIEAGDDGATLPGHFDGIIFEGINFEDNAGSSLLGGAGLEELPLGGGFLIGARFAKPLFTNPNGIGAGEAYLIYNDLSRINRRYSLNAVGAKLSSGDGDPNALAGLRFAGIAFDQSPEDINGDGLINLYSEDADGDQRLDLFDEDVDGDGLVESTVEDADLDGNADLAEDGFVGVDANGDGKIDDPSQRFFIDQYVNGAMDANLSEDRDGDGTLDAIGDATWGLSSLALLPDVDGDGLPELAFGFEFTDSLVADFRREVLGEVQPPNFGDLSQENQFERGGIVIIPSSDEATMVDPFLLGIGEDRVIQLDFVGQLFDPSPEDADEDDDDQNTTGVIPPDSARPANRPLNGHDVYPYVRDLYGDGDNPANCDEDQVELIFINNLIVDLPARATFNITEAGDGGNTETLELVATTAAFARSCIDAGDTAVNIVPVSVVILNPDTGGDPVPLFPGADTSQMSSHLNLIGGTVAYGVGGDGFFAIARDSDLIFGGDTCSISATDGCFETMVGPFYGFTYASVDPFMESPTHPLAYRRTLANPDQRAFEFGILESGCDLCGRVLTALTTILDGGAPSFGTISTGFYPGEAVAPVGARILGQRVGDRFGIAISDSKSIDRRVFVGAPRRRANGMENSGAVYQFKMERFWDSANDLAGLNDFDVPKPHQYIIKEVGSSRPDSLLGAQRSSMNDALIYSGADEGDRLGEAVIGIADFNSDAKPDILMGAPGADGRDDAFADSGAAYVIYRLPTDIETSTSLEKLELDPADPNRLNGLLINGDLGDQLGAVLDGNCDLNGDGHDDIVFGSPLHGGNDNGEVIIIWGGQNLASPGGGYSLQELVDLGRAVRIQGAVAGDQAGFNIDCNGDFDGDGQDDLVIAAPFATPMFDSDGDDILDAPGLDLNRDGQIDLDENGVPILEDPAGAGVVYVITNGEALSGTLNLSQMGSALQGFIFAGLKGGDNLGGGFDSKRATRSQGLTYAGDVNGDGKDDLLVSSMLADPITGGGTPKTNAGEVYLIYGFNASQAADF